MRFEGRTPPDIFFSLPQWNNWIEIFLHGMDQKAADDYTAELAKSGFPCGIYMMDGGWLSHQGSYVFYEKDFPDPHGLFDRINAGQRQDRRTSRRHLARRFRRRPRRPRDATP